MVPPRNLELIINYLVDFFLLVVTYYIIMYARGLNRRLQFRRKEIDSGLNGLDYGHSYV